MQQMKPPGAAPRRLREIPGYRDLNRANKNLVKIVVGMLITFALLFVVGVVFGKQLAGVAVILLFAFPCLLPFVIFYAVMITIRIRRSQRGQLLYDNRQRERQDQQYTQQAARQVQTAPDMVQARNGPPFGVFGAAIDGDLHTWLAGQWLTIPEPELAKHGIVLGGSGSGKTVSLLRIAYVAARIYGYKVFYLDAKGDRATAAQFVAMMHAAQVGRVRMFPREPFNGFRGDANAILNRLMAIEEYSEPYYKALAKRLLTLASRAPGGAPKDSRDLLKRLNTDLLKQLYAGREEVDELDEMSAKDAAGVRNRYRSFFGSIEGKLDNGWSWEDADAGYVLLDGLALREEAAALGRYLIEDFANYAASRKPGQVKALLIIDEYSALSTASSAANLFERLRSFGAAVLVSSQSYGGLGEQDQAERMLDAGNFLLVHRSANPEQFIRRAGMYQQIQESATFSGPSGGAGGARLQEVSSIHPDQVRRLGTGDAYLIAHGRYEKVRAAPAPMPGPGEIDQARTWITEVPPAAIQAPAAPPIQNSQAQPSTELPATQVEQQPGPELL
jgi:hypothetical protein